MCFGGIPIHTLPLTGQRLLAVSLFLSIRCPERGNMCFGWDTFFLSITSCPARGFVGIGNDIHKKCLCPARGFVGIGNQEDLFKLTDLMQSLG